MNKKAVTLIELLLAVSLMGLIMLLAANVEKATRTFYFRADRQGQLQVRLSAAMEHMVKNLSLVHGEINNSGIDLALPGDSQIVFRRDRQVGGIYTPQDYTDDAWMRYWRVGDQIMFCQNWDRVGLSCLPPATVETICNDNVTNLLFIPQYLAPPRAYVEIRLSGVDVDIPEVTLNTYVFPRSNSNN